MTRATRHIAVLMFAALVITPQRLSAQGKADVELRAAMETETIKGDLNGAIKQYRALVDRFAKTDRASAAKALLRMAQVYEKLGDAQAIKVYERLTQEFPSQPEAAEARKHLTVTSLRPAAGASVLCVDCVADPRAALSADGRLLAFKDKTSARLTVRDLSTGQDTVVTERTAVHPVFSPDGRHLAYSCGGEPHQLFVQSIRDGASPRLLLDNDEFEYVVPTAWSPDGASLLVQISHQDETWQTAWVSVSNGRVKVLKSLDWRRGEGRFDQRPALSPDGRFIAYAALATNPGKPSAGADAPEHIYVLASDGSVETQITTAAGLYGFPTWTADGSQLLYTTARMSGGPIDLWSVALKGGKPIAPPALVKVDIGKAGLIGTTPAGRLYAIVSSSDLQQTVVTSMPGEGDASQSPPAARVFVGANSWWSPDSRYVATMAPATLPCGRGAGCVADVRIGSLETGSQQIYPLPSGFLAPINGLAWLHDGTAVLVEMQETQTGVWSLGRLEVKTGRFSRAGALPEPGGLAVSSNDKTAYLLTVPANRATLFALDLDTAHTQVVVPSVFEDGENFGSGPNQTRLDLVRRDPSLVSLFHWSLSPDGKTLACAITQVADVAAPANGLMGTLTAVDLADGAARELYRNTAAGVISARWTTRNEIIFTVVTGGGPNPVIKVMRMPAAGGRPETILGLPSSPQVAQLNLSPDGSRIAYSKSTPGSSQLVALELPGSLTSGK